VKSEGVLYKRFTTSAGELFVIDSQPLRKRTIEAGKCSRFKTKGGGQEGKRDVETLRADIPLPDSDWKAFGGLIQATVEDKCSETQAALRRAPVSELGVSKTVTGKDGNQRKYQLFNKGLGSNLNFGLQF
jgi:hypothetical protein